MKFIYKNMLTFCIHFSTFFQILVANSMQNLALSAKETDAEEYFSIVSCIVEISENELFWRPTIILESERDQSDSKNQFVSQVISKFTDINVPFMIIDNIKNGTLDVTEASFLVIGYFEDCDTLTNFDFDAAEEKIKYLIILENYSVEICTRNFHDIDDVIGKFEISFFIKNSEQIYELFTYVPEINPQNCTVVVGKPRKINACRSGKLLNELTFPLKNPTNMNKCPIKVGMGSLFPFSMIEDKETLANNDHIDTHRVKGMDLEIIKIAFKYFNATIDLHYIFKLEENAFLNKEFIELVWNGTLEICAGGLYRIYGDTVEYSGVYARQTITWIYYTERLPRSWQNLITTIEGLYLFITFYLSYSLVWYLICMFDEEAVSLKDTLIFAWGVLVGNASLQHARTLKQKILNIVYLIMCLHLSVYINIQLYSFFTIHRPPEMFKTNDAVMESGKVSYLHALTKYFMNDEKYIQFANTSVDCNSFADCSFMSVTHKGMTVVLQGFAYSFQAATAVNDEARMLRPAENLLTVYYEMIIKKQHRLVAKFKGVIERLFEAGITDKLFTEAIGATVVAKAKIVAQNVAANSYSCQTGCRISLDQFGGVLYIVIYGSIASFVIFVIELVVKR